MLVINCKNYAEAMDAASVRSLVAEARQASARHRVPIAVAPPAPMLAMAAEASLRPAGMPAAAARRQRRLNAAPEPVPWRPLVLSQHADDAGEGSTTGHVAAAALKAAGASGSLVNHSECRMPAPRLGRVIELLRAEGLASIACAGTLSAAAKTASLAPDYVAIEPSSLIGTGRAISKVRPGLITRAAEALARAPAPRAVRPGRTAGGRQQQRPQHQHQQQQPPPPRRRSAPPPPPPRRPRLLCGAGISSAEDVRLAVELGSAGVLVASGIVKADNRAAAVDSFAKAMAAALRENSGRE